jgi:hypothetical protein
MLKETRLDEFHSCKQGSGGGRFACLGGLLSTRRTTRLTSATILELFASQCSRSRFGRWWAGQSCECGVQGRGASSPDAGLLTGPNPRVVVSEALLNSIGNVFIYL